ncbi:hypothetical protein J3B02_001963 [Coemansia erecta]|uniref:Uncharacterized protein n=1 Tax=Coemansia asiatica TaxID=1052880 RepID=A0A9W7XRA5_9FUNG|nr:hypothetical protein LPJ64_000819 [Coemansia asiatica]KAJ2855810.1 hypothetical protein J3B02_001963 [Coemansia erecta]
MIRSIGTLPKIALYLQRRSFSASIQQLAEKYPYQISRFAQQSSPKRAALTFGKQTDGTQTSAIIGWLQHSNIDAMAIDGQQIQPQDFAENKDFWPQVVQVLSQHAHEDPELQSQAAFFKNGWMNVVDNRNPPPPGRTGDAQDILGSVLVENKKIAPGSFQANLAHRPVTRHGLFQLPKHLHEKLVDYLSLADFSASKTAK